MMYSLIRDLPSFHLRKNKAKRHHIRGAESVSEERERETRVQLKTREQMGSVICLDCRMH